VTPEGKVVQGILLRCMKDVPESVATDIATKIHALLLTELTEAGQANNGTQAAMIVWVASAICSFLLHDELTEEDTAPFAEALEHLFHLGIRIRGAAEKTLGWEEFGGGAPDGKASR